jgi:uncharacterized metal-binding protein YceD (DUF177 family)
MKKTLELPRIVSLATLKEQRYFTTEMTSTAEENKALAKRYEVLDVNFVKAGVKIKSLGEGHYRVQLHYQAEIVQACGLTLEPVVELIDDTHEELLTTKAEELLPFDEADPHANIPTELIQNDEIDYGEIVAQLVALSLDPFPRAVPQGEQLFSHVEHSHNPFAALTQLKPKTDKTKD